MYVDDFDIHILKMEPNLNIRLNFIHIFVIKICSDRILEILLSFLIIVISRDVHN